MSTSGWTATDNGWVIARRDGNDFSCQLYVIGAGMTTDNAVLAWETGQWDTEWGAGMIPVTKGDKVQARAYDYAYGDLDTPEGQYLDNPKDYFYSIIFVPAKTD